MRRHDPNRINPQDRAKNRSWRLRDVIAVVEHSRLPLSMSNRRAIRKVLVDEAVGLRLEEDGRPLTAAYVQACNRLQSELDRVFADGAPPVTAEIRARLIALRDEVEATLPANVLVPASGGSDFGFGGDDLDL